jgi:hypothetical protein
MSRVVTHDARRVSAGPGGMIGLGAGASTYSGRLCVTAPRGMCITEEPLVFEPGDTALPPAVIASARRATLYVCLGRIAVRG